MAVGCPRIARRVLVRVVLGVVRARRGREYQGGDQW